jgi:tetratricopeptide (TPR) repeat protein
VSQGNDSRRPQSGVFGAFAAPVALLALLSLAPGAAAEDFETCWGHYEGGQWKQAASCFEAILPEFEGWAWGHHYLGVSYQQSGQSGPALKELAKAMDLMGSDEDPASDPFLTAAGILESQRKYREAMDVLGRAEPYLRGEDEAEVEAMRGRLHFGLENWSESIKHLKRSRRKDFQTWYRLGVAQYRDGDLEAATDALEEAHGKDRSHASTVDFLALAFAKRAESMRDDRTREQLWGRAADIGKSMIASNPRNADAHNLYARALMGSKRYDEALGEFRKVLEIKPGHCFAKYNLGQLYLAKKDWKQAISHGGKAVGCLKGRDEKRNAHMVVGDSHMGVAKGQVESLADDDVAGRRAAIGTYKKALEQFRAAKRIRGSSGLDGKIEACGGTIAGLEEQIETLGENAATLAANEAAVKAAEERQRALDAATKKK